MHPPVFYYTKELAFDLIKHDHIDHMDHIEHVEHNIFFKNWIEQLFLMKYGIATDIVYWHDKLVDISREIEKETSSRKACSKVFVTFEKEKSQRKCLKAMRTGEGGREGGGVDGRGREGPYQLIQISVFS